MVNIFVVRWTAEYALRFVQSKRKCICPNLGFLKILFQLETSLINKTYNYKIIKKIEVADKNKNKYKEKSNANEENKDNGDNTKRKEKKKNNNRRNKK